MAARVVDEARWQSVSHQRPGTHQHCLDIARGDRVDDFVSMSGPAGAFGTGGNCDPLRRRRTPKPPPRTLQVSTTSRAMPRGLRHAICPSRRGGPAVGRLRPARPRGGRAASCGPRAPADVSRRGGAPARRRGRAALCRGRVSGVPRVRMARWRVRTISVHWMPCRALGGVLVLSADRHYEEFGAQGLSMTGSGHGSTPDIFLPESQAMSRSSTWKTPRRRSGGRAASMMLSFSVGSARR